MKTKAQEMVKILSNAGFKAYWAGGCVRDMIMGIVMKTGLGIIIGKGLPSKM